MFHVHILYYELLSAINLGTIWKNILEGKRSLSTGQRTMWGSSTYKGMVPQESLDLRARGPAKSTRSQKPLLNPGDPAGIQKLMSVRSHV